MPDIAAPIARHLAALLVLLAAWCTPAVAESLDELIPSLERLPCGGGERDVKLPALRGVEQRVSPGVYFGVPVLSHDYASSETAVGRYGVLAPKETFSVTFNFHHSGDGHQGLSLVGYQQLIYLGPEAGTASQTPRESFQRMAEALSDRLGPKLPHPPHGVRDNYLADWWKASRKDGEPVLVAGGGFFHKGAALYGINTICTRSYGEAKEPHQGSPPPPHPTEISPPLG